jgi:dihydrofolate reductase
MNCQKMIAIVVATDENNAIGKNNRLLWHLTEDLKRFKSLTVGHPVIMGRKTFESIGKPLSDRTNIIISRNPKFVAEGILIAPSLDEAIRIGSEINDILFIIGGATVYKEAIHVTDTIYLTTIHNRYDADAFFPTISENEWTEIERIDFDRGRDFNHPFSFLTLKKR